MVAPSTTSPALTSDLLGNAGAAYRPGYYRTANNDLYQAQAVAQFAYHELGLRTVAAIHDGDPYTSGLTGAFRTAFEDLGGAVPVAAVSRGETDMVPVLAQLAANGPDGLFFPLFEDEGAAVVRQVGRVAGLEGVTRIGGAALLVSEFLAVPESEGVYLPGPELRFDDNVNEATGRSGGALVADYRARYGEAPTAAYLPHAYDATTMLLRAIEDVAVVDGDTLYVDRAQLREALTRHGRLQGHHRAHLLRRVRRLRDGPRADSPPHRCRRHGHRGVAHRLPLRALSGARAGSTGPVTAAAETTPSPSVGR